MYLLEGTAPLQRKLHLKMGDFLIFAQKADASRTIVLAGRPPTPHDNPRKAPVRKYSATPGKGPGVQRQQSLVSLTPRKADCRRS